MSHDQPGDPEGGCPGFETNFETIVPHTIEETRGGGARFTNKDWPNLQEDVNLLFQVIFYSQLAERAGLV